LMRIAILSPIAWRTPPRHWEPRQRVVSLLTEGLVERGVDVTLFATADSQTRARLHAVAPAPYLEEQGLDPGVWECMQLGEVLDHAHEFDLVHNHLDFLPLTCAGLTGTPLLTTVHGPFSSRILPVYKKYDHRTYYVSISNSARSAELDYIANVYYGIDFETFSLNEAEGEYLLFFCSIHSEAGTKEAVEIAEHSGMNLIIAGTIADLRYFQEEIQPALDGTKVKYVGSVGPNQCSGLMGSARALLYPTMSCEPFALPAVECNACGTPVIAYNVGSIRELVTDGLNGFLVADVTEAVEAVGKIRSISRRMCRESVQKRFSRDCMVEEYIKIYERILEMSKREDHRPWGYYQVLLDQLDHKVKEIVVYPGKRLSLQQHKHRSEHWTIISGSAVVTLNDHDVLLTAGQSVDIPAKARHRVYNPGTERLVFIEIQTGSYFGENDIERFEDDFGRV
jgi:mannose-6-phosphate isomerase-like protein (cupin superfamily)